MYRNSRVAVIIAAAGKGRRFGAPVPKQYVEIGGQPIILRTIKVFEQIDEVDHIFIVASSDYLDYCRRLVDDNSIDKVEGIVEGGIRRQDSVYNALQEVNRQCPGVSYVLIHDGARPFVTHDTVLNVIRATAESGAAVACVAMKNSVRRISDEGSCSVDRADYMSVQTPQGFRKAVLMEAYDRALNEGYEATDDAALVERIGQEIALVEGDYQNIKITTKEDLPMENRVGTGFDVHRLVDGRKLILCGVDIPYERGLDGHSDADVAVHALMDALLGAAAMGDIGRHFPDTDDRYLDASSIGLLEEVRNRISEGFFSVGNVDITIIAQLPKIQPYIDRMRSNIAGALDVELSRVNIKATTTEGLGFTGRGEGIAAEAVCTIYR